MSDILKLSQLSTDERHRWDAALVGGKSFLENCGVTSRFDFVETLDAVLVPSAAERRIWKVDGGNRVIFFPCYVERKKGGVFAWSELRHISDLYPGRSAVAGLVGREDDSVAVLSKVFDEYDGWDCFSLTVIADSPMEKNLLAISNGRRFVSFLESELEYPYIELPTEWDDLYGSFAKKFRYNIRNSLKLLRDCGQLELRRTTDVEEVPRFLQDAYEIERNSWKESAGSSLTTNERQEEFHTRLASLAAKQEILRAYILYLDGSPIAHVFGVLCDGVFYSLKLSYSEEYRKYSPGTVVTALVIQELISDQVSFWDFAGPTEEYKRRWTSKSYNLRSYTVFNRSLRGQLLVARRKIKDLIDS